MAEGDNEMVWLEETALYCSVRMRKGLEGSKGVKYRNRGKFDSCFIAKYIDI